MDTDAINPTKSVQAQPQRSVSKPGGSGGSAPSAAPVQTQSAEDTVSLSREGREALDNTAVSRGSGESGTSQNVSDSQTGQATKQRKFDLTENNELVLKIVDGRTQRVEKQIPPEDAIQLRQAIQDGIENFDHTDQ